MDLVKARKKAQEKTGKSKPKSKESAPPEQEERIAEAPAAPEPAPAPQRDRAAAKVPQATEEVEVFDDTAFGEDLPPMMDDGDDSLDELILGSLEDELKRPGRDASNLELASEEDVEEIALAAPKAKRPPPKQAEAKPSSKAASPPKSPAKSPAAPRRDEGRSEAGWVVSGEPGAPSGKPSGGSRPPRVEMDWDVGPDVFSLSDLAPEDEDFFSLVTEDLYQREFGRHEETAEGTHLALLSFRLAKEIYAVPLTSIKQIIKMLPVTRVPRVPPHVLGIISLRGTIIPIFDLRRVLQLTAGDASRKTRIVIVSQGKFTVGMVVDEVEQVVRFPENKIEPPPPVMGGGEADYVKGIGRIGAKMIILLALDKILIPVMSMKAGG